MITAVTVALTVLAYIGIIVGFVAGCVMVAALIWILAGAVFRGMVRLGLLP